MHPFICVLFVLFAVTSAAEKGSSCVTPNGERATCIPIHSCRPIKDAITYLEADAIDFARESQCGRDVAPLVCCGSFGRLTTPVPPPQAPPKVTEPPTPVAATAVPIKNLLLPDSSLCGLQSKPNKESGTRATEVHEYPWLVALKYRKDDGTPGGIRCMGTLINQRYVLTAAQCLKIPGYDLCEARLGKWNFSAPQDCYLGPMDEEICTDPLDIPVVEKVSHPYYNNKSGNNDIALVRLERKVKYSPIVRPICLPPSDFLAPPAGTPMETTGWTFIDDGKPSSIKLKANITMVGDEECDVKFPNFTQRNINKACVRGEEKFVCPEESGRPVFRNYIKEDPTDERQWYQEGILYEQPKCEEEEEGSPFLYTRVSRYINWILNNIRKS